MKYSNYSGWLVIPAVAERNATGGSARGAGISTFSKEIPVSSYRRNRNDTSARGSKMHRSNSYEIY